MLTVPQDVVGREIGVEDVEPEHALDVGAYGIEQQRRAIGREACVGQRSRDAAGAVLAELHQDCSIGGVDWLRHSEAGAVEAPQHLPFASGPGRLLHTPPEARAGAEGARRPGVPAADPVDEAAFPIAGVVLEGTLPAGAIHLERELLVSAGGCSPAAINGRFFAALDGLPDFRDEVEVDEGRDARFEIDAAHGHAIAPGRKAPWAHATARASAVCARARSDELTASRELSSGAPVSLATRGYDHALTPRRSGTLFPQLRRSGGALKQSRLPCA
jgi:hypothetical protein